MSAKLQAPRGTFDVLPDDAARRVEVEQVAQRILGGAGYRKIETPVFEATELFARGVGESTDIVRKEMYSFDDGGGRSLTLRPEGTAPICRAYLEHGMHKEPQPVRLWYLGPYFRAERAQAGRYRQFWQVGAEAIGADSPALDAEVIVLLADLLGALGVRELRLRLNTLGSGDSRERYRAALDAHLAGADLPESVREVARLNPLRLFDHKDPSVQSRMADAPLLVDFLDADDAEHFATVRELLEDSGLPFELDTGLVRGLDYYRRTIFEFTSDALGAQSGVGGGGRYDGLIELLGGPPTPGVGWAAGVERMMLAGGDRRVAAPVVDLYVALAKPERGADAFRLAHESRRAGLAARLEVAGRSLKAQLKQADKLGARYVAILGDEDAALKDLETGEQRELPFDDVIPAILRSYRTG